MTARPIPHVRPDSLQEELVQVVTSDKNINRTLFIREQSASFFREILHNLHEIASGDLQKIAEECVRTAEFIWEESKSMTR